MAALPGLIAHASEARARLRDAFWPASNPAKIKTRAALAALPVTRKSELGALQKRIAAARRAERDAGRKLAQAVHLARPDLRAGRTRRATGGASRAASTRRASAPGDVVLNTFAYHFTPAGSMLESGAHALGCTVFPAGTGQTEMQVAAIADLAPAAYVGTPSFLKLIVEKADELKADISRLQKAQVGAEYLPPPLRDCLRERGIRVYADAMPRADLGLIAYDR